MVLLVTGLCGNDCPYCPLSDARKGKDVIFANEMKVTDIEGVFEEADAMEALGTGITGGDPLLVLERTLSMIAGLKARFGADHHIHLYTATLDLEAFASLEGAGLDELRYHPPAESWKQADLEQMARFKRYSHMDIGLEVPVLPGEAAGLRTLLQEASRIDLDFVNLTELEFSEGNYQALRLAGLSPRDDVSAAIEGSEKLAMELLTEPWGIPVHYCSSSFKDGVQLRNRLLRRAERIAGPGDVVTNDGTLLKGVIEGVDPTKTREFLMSEFNVPVELMRMDPERNRLEVAPWVLEEIFQEIDLDCHIVEEYPTADRLEVERTPLRRR